MQLGLAAHALVISQPRWSWSYLLQKNKIGVHNIQLIASHQQPMATSICTSICETLKYKKRLQRNGVRCTHWDCQAKTGVWIRDATTLPMMHFSSCPTCRLLQTSPSSAVAFYSARVAHRPAVVSTWMQRIRGRMTLT